MNEDLINTKFKTIVDSTTMDQIYEKVDDLMPEYVSDDWADDFDDIEEAYEEQGRGQAEDQAIKEAIETVINNDLDLDEYVELHDMLKEHYEL